MLVRWWGVEVAVCTYQGINGATYKLRCVDTLETCNGICCVWGPGQIRSGTDGGIY